MNQDAIGYYGQEWKHFMEDHYPKLVAQMQKHGIYDDVAISVNRSACDYGDVLRTQYAKQNPPPDEPEQYRKWKFTRDHYIESAVMRERVLVAVTKP